MLIEFSVRMLATPASRYLALMYALSLPRFVNWLLEFSIDVVDLYIQRLPINTALIYCILLRKLFCCSPYYSCPRMRSSLYLPYPRVCSVRSVVIGFIKFNFFAYYVYVFTILSFYFVNILRPRCVLGTCIDFWLDVYPCKKDPLIELNK